MRAMPAFLKRRLAATIGTLLAPLGLAACGAMCPAPDELENATRFPAYSDGQRGSSLHVRLPFATWVNNERLDAFLRKAVEVGGAESLVAKYGFQCSAQPAATPCADCYTCQRTVPQVATELRGMTTVCVGEGDMLLHVDIGPGSTVRAMSYWQASPEVRRKWAR